MRLILFSCIAILLITSSLCFRKSVKSSHHYSYNWPPKQSESENGDSQGYIACYCNCPETGLYQVDSNIYFIGVLKEAGKYDDHLIFQPKGYEGQDISAAPYFKKICTNAFPGCGPNGCWAGGDTANLCPAIMIKTYILTLNILVSISIR